MALTEQQATDRIWALIEEPETDLPYSAIEVGEDDGAYYYLVIVEREHEGNVYLNERYVLLSKPDNQDIDDTWMKNGINRRVPSTTMYLADALGHEYAAISGVEAAMGTGDIDADEWSAEDIHHRSLIG